MSSPETFRSGITPNLTRRGLLSVGASLGAAVALAGTANAAPRPYGPSVRRIPTAAWETGTVLRVSTLGHDPVDATEFLQAALDSTADTVVIDNAHAEWISGPLFVRRSNVTIILESGVTLRAKAGAFPVTQDCQITVGAVENVNIYGYGAQIVMNKPEYTEGEWRHALSLRGSQQVVVAGLVLADSGGDGIYVGAGQAAPLGPCVDITIRDCILDNHRRNDMSVISVEGLVVERCAFTNAGGTHPQTGLDFEPNGDGEKLKRIVVRDCYFNGNIGSSLYVIFVRLRPTSDSVDLRFERCFFGESASGIPNVRIYSHALGGPDGSLDFVDCFSQRTTGYNGGILITGKQADRLPITLDRTAWVDWANTAGSYLPVGIHAFANGGVLPDPYGGVTITNSSLLTNASGASVGTTAALTPEGSSWMQDVTGTLVATNPNGVVTDYGADPHDVTLDVQPTSRPDTAVSLAKLAPLYRAGEDVVLEFSRPTADPWALGARCSFSGDAIEGIDYGVGSRCVVIPPGERKARLTIPVLDVSTGPARTLTATVEPGPGVVAAGDPVTVVVHSR